MRTAIVTLLLSGCSLQAQVLVSGGKPSASIWMAPSAAPAVTRAANEIRSFVKHMSGVELAVREGPGDSGSGVVLAVDPNADPFVDRYWKTKRNQAQWEPKTAQNSPAASTPAGTK